jgi:protoporphyrinogen oxidase
LVSLAREELSKLKIVDQELFLDATVVRVPDAYPGYFGTYRQFAVVRNFLDSFENLFLIGRNGMHRYNNQDHSMLTAFAAVDLIVDGSNDKSKIWSVNAEEEYLEIKRAN